MCGRSLLLPLSVNLLWASADTYRRRGRGKERGVPPRRQPKCGCVLAREIIATLLWRRVQMNDMAGKGGGELGERGEEQLVARGRSFKWLKTLESQYRSAAPCHAVPVDQTPVALRRSTRTRLRLQNESLSSFLFIKLGFEWRRNCVRKEREWRTKLQFLYSEKIGLLNLTKKEKVRQTCLVNAGGIR